MSSEPSRVLLAEPDIGVADSLRSALEVEGYRVTSVRSSQEVFEAVSRSGFEFFVLDTQVLGNEEASLINFLHARSPDARLILTASPRDAERALRAAQRSTALSLLKPVRPSDLIEILERLRSEAAATEELPSDVDTGPFWFHGMVGRSRLMRRVLRLVAKVAPSDAAVILSGETGTGKELIARMIHRLSRRADHAFVTVNCGSIPERLLESELFGHKKGSFTDAIADKKGLFEFAHGGTLLLDEVGELAPEAQVKLLRAIEDMEIRRVGDVNPIRVNVRVVAATNRDLLEEVHEGRFREDLYFRLNVVQIHLPPLRDRREDVEVLFRHFLDDANRRLKRAVMAPSPQAAPVLRNYAFPGNVRELKNLVEHAVVMADKETIRLEDLPPQVVAAARSHRLLAEPHRVITGTVTDGRTGGGGEAGFKTLAEAERELIRDTLSRLEGNQTEAAKRLGISRSTLWRKMKQYEINLEG